MNKRADNLKETLLDEGDVSFSIESRIVRELGERLVKQPEVAILELIKNAYDADARTCTVDYDYPDTLVVADDGHGMTQAEFLNAWMRIGTSAKGKDSKTRRFKRVISGEKGIGRFAVRYLGKKLELETTALDKKRGHPTLLRAAFDWPTFDKTEDLGSISVHYTLHRAPGEGITGTTLRVLSLRKTAESIKFREVQTASMGLVSPYKTLLREEDEDIAEDLPDRPKEAEQDPGFQLVIHAPQYDQEPTNVSASILSSFVLRCVVGLEDNRLKVRLYRRGDKKPRITINDKYETSLGRVYADIRFFPSRSGTFTDLAVDGRLARTWVKEHGGVAVFDRNFRISPYGMAGDDWLSLAADRVKAERDPRSRLAKRHFAMNAATHKSTQLNYMLRLPYPEQLIGAVQVFGVRSEEEDEDATGLVATADREGFVDNRAFKSLVDVIRGAVELIAFADRELQQEEDKEEQKELVALLRRQTRDAIKEIQAHPNLSQRDKTNIIRRLVDAESAVTKHEEIQKRRETALEVMSLLGVVAGFMTHEFGAAIHDLEQSHTQLSRLAKKDESFQKDADAISKRIESLRDFVAYSQGYIRGAADAPDKRYPARPRIQQVKRVFGKYAEDRGIGVLVDIENEVMAPRVPVSLYSGIALNLYTNALKAVTARSGDGPRKIVFRAWNEKSTHYLEVSDTGIGIPTALRERVFDPLFTTTETNRDPLGSGMGLGLTLVRRGAETFGGQVRLTDPPPGYATCFRVTFPL